MVKEKNVVVWLILSIVTCGIAGVVWFIQLTNDANTLTPNDKYQTSGGMALLFTLLTCGIYGYFWCYKMGEKYDALTGKQNGPILFLVLGIFGLGIIDYLLLQNAINENATA